ncbi:hypothetical protein ENINCK372B1_21095 [Enterobacter intestinihominis]
MRGNIRLWWSFRSRYVPYYSVTTWPVNVPGWLSRHHPGDPGFRRKIAASRYLRLIPSGLSGTGGGNIPVKPALSAHPCASPRPTGNASAIYSRTEASLKALSYSEATLSLLLSNYWGTLSPVGEGWGEGIKPHILQLRKHLTRCVDGVIDIFFAVRHGHKARFKR